MSSPDPTFLTIEPARCAAELHAACRVRAAAYAHHLGALGDRLGTPDALDALPATLVLLARLQPGGEPVGTARLQFGSDGEPLQLESALSLPAEIVAGSRAEVTRLAVRAGAAPRVKLLLMKAIWLACLARGARWLVIGARSDALVRDYRRLGFRDVLDAASPVALAHAGGLPHRILALDVANAERDWRAAGHPLYGFMVEARHAELRLDDGVASRAWPMAA